MKMTKAMFAVMGPAALFATTALSPARAETADASPPAASAAVEQVVVTANKREQSLQDVPISIGVIDAKAVQQHNIDDIEDITRTIPGISFTANNGPGQDNISIRGVNSSVGNPTVGIYIDEVPLITTNGYQGQATPLLVDLDRIEVLRGPQGTLYGASSEGGTIRFLTNQPNASHFAANFRSELSGTQHGGLNFDEQGMVNIPLVQDKAAIRISGEYGHDSGFIDRYDLSGKLLQKGVNGQDQAALHISGKVDLSGDFSITPSLFLQQLSANDAPTFMPDLGLYKQDKEIRETDRDTLFIPMLTVKKGFSFGDLTSVSAYYVRQINRVSDGTFYNSGALSEFFLDPAYPEQQPANDSILANIASPERYKDRFQTFTQELRLSSPADWKRVKWVGGLFFSDQRWTHFDRGTTPGFRDAFAQIYGFNINDSVLGDPTNPHLWDDPEVVWQVYDRNHVTQYAAFGQIDIDITPRLHASIGDRYVYAKETFSEFGAGFFDIGGAGTNGTPYTQGADFSASTPRFSLSYDLSQDANVYGVASKGFRLGGATTPNTNVACTLGLDQLGYYSAPTTYGSDELWSYELGSKSVLFGHTLSVNVDGYYIDWKRIQQTILIPICGGQFNANVGDAVAYGGELEVRYKPPIVPGLGLGLNYGAERAVITRTINPDTAAVGQNVLNTPQWTLSATVDYTHMLTAQWDGFLHADYSFVGRSNGSFIIGDTNYYNPAYDVVGLNFGARNMKGLELSVFAKNLGDNRAILQRPTVNTVVEGYTLRPRTIGIALNMRF
jgi:outer membrane receptor protein involved in Fe transport